MAPETIDAVTRTATSSNHNGIGLCSRLVRLVRTALFGRSQPGCYSTFGKVAMYVPERDFEKTRRTLRTRTWALLRWLRKNRNLLHLTSLFERPAQNSVFSYKYEATVRESAETLSEDEIFLLYSKSEQEHDVSGSALDEAQLASSSRPPGESDRYL